MPTNLSYPDKSLTPSTGEGFTLLQTAFIQHYTAIGTTSYGNATQSYWLATNGSCMRSTASVEGCKLLKAPKVQEAIAHIQRSQGMDYQVRDARLKEIINGTHVALSEVEVQRKNKDTGELETESIVTTRRTPTGGDIIRAVDVLNKMDGTYVARQAEGSVMSAELKRMFKDSMRDVTPPKEGTGEGGGQGASACHKRDGRSPRQKNTEGGMDDGLFE